MTTENDPTASHALPADLQAKAEELAAQERADHAVEVAEVRDRNNRRIILGDRPLREITTDALVALQVYNSPPLLFIRSGRIVRIVIDEEGVPSIQGINELSLRHVLERACDFIRVRQVGPKTKPSWEDVPTPPPRPVVEDLLALPATLWGLPPLIGISESPVLHDDGEIVSSPGYDAETKLYLHTTGLTLPDIPEAPEPEEIAKALAMLDEIVCDFPFLGDADRANFFSALFTVVLRPAISGPVPLFAIDKNQAGTGGTLLASVIAAVASGRDGVLTTAPSDEQSWAKKITSLLVAGRTLSIVDNIESKLHSPNLAAVITAPQWEDRLLGRTEMIAVPVRTTWVVTGNNIQLGGDLPRRTVWIRLVAGESRPWQRQGFRHSDLLSWVRVHRGEILAAVFTLSRGWVRADSPEPADLARMGSFESWRSIVGGILVHHGKKDLLGNLEELYETVDQDGPQWDLFAQQITAHFKPASFTARDLTRFMENQNTAGLDRLADYLPDPLIEPWSRNKDAFSRALGGYLKRRLDQITLSGLVLRKDGKSHGAVQWTFANCGKQTPLTPPTPHQQPLMGQQGGVRENTTTDEKGSHGESPCTQCVSEKNDIENGWRETPPTSPTPRPYSGQSRKELTAILQTYGGVAAHIPDPDLFRDAWKQAGTGSDRS